MDQRTYTTAPTDKHARELLLISAAMSTLFGVLYFVGLIGKLVINGSIHAVSSQGISMVFAAIGLTWNITLVILFAALRRQSKPEKSIYAEIGLLFIALMAGVSCINWFAQLTIVPQIAQSGNITLLALVDIHNTNSLLYAMEHLAWGIFYGLASIFMALSIEGGAIETWIRWLFVACGVMSILFLPGVLIHNQFLIDLGYYAAGICLPIATLLILVRYRHA